MADVDNKILDLVKANPDGITQADITSAIPDVGASDIAKSINTLMKKHLQVFSKGNTLLFRLQKETRVGDNQTETVVLEIISNAGDKGIWMQEITKKSNIASVQLAKVLKNLETKKRIKTIKSVAASRKKLFMLFDLTPDVSITGGLFYSKQDFDIELAETLNEESYDYIEKKHQIAKANNVSLIQAREASAVSANDVLRYIEGRGFMKVEVPLKELERVLYTLVLDKKIHKISKNGTNFYRYRQPTKTAGIVVTPCGLCPVKKDCCDTGDITPVKCEYINKWLELY
ncbi:probable DNA-directed RNA polymerase III subunit RPC6 [Aphidius gifuensis]|uniref:probable DNA-directed RNA polymerase III subunit RPC6 n=1 Tax=Aphidius gifuensis TaxID=684658 RepID=UPI001CDBF6BD|nr:probable DNA-directed RNA polymerase III subunit RPC6 [Aphidius gifuensis]